MFILPLSLFIFLTYLQWNITDSHALIYYHKIILSYKERKNAFYLINHRWKIYSPAAPCKCASLYIKSSLCVTNAKHRIRVGNRAGSKIFPSILLSGTSNFTAESERCHCGKYYSGEIPFFSGAASPDREVKLILQHFECATAPLQRCCMMRFQTSTGSKDV